jgi:hypothetical protein
MSKESLFAATATTILERRPKYPDGRGRDAGGANRNKESIEFWDEQCRPRAGRYGDLGRAGVPVCRRRSVFLKLLNHNMPPGGIARVIKRQPETEVPAPSIRIGAVASLHAGHDVVGALLCYLKGNRFADGELVQ